MKCQVNSSISHKVLISKQISYKSYKEICSGETKKVNLGYWGNAGSFKVENNSLVQIEREPTDYIHGRSSIMPYDSEVLSQFFSTHNIDQNWLHCDFSSGYYDEDLGGWTGCVGKVWGLNIERDDWVRLLDWEGWSRYCYWRSLLLFSLKRRSSSLCSGIYLSSWLLVLQISS